MSRRSHFLGLVFFVLFVLGTGLAYADFYVISVGNRAKRTILVSPKATPAESGTALLSALDKITDASETNPYLIILEPGIYDLGTTILSTKSWVDIQGSGENVTKIKGNYSTDWNLSSVIRVTSNVELRFLSVEHTGSGLGSLAIRIAGKDNIRLTHVTARAVSGAAEACGIYSYVSSFEQPHITLTHVTAMAEGTDRSYAITNGWTNTYASHMTGTNVTAVATNGSVTCRAINNNQTAEMNLHHATLIADGEGASSEVYGVYNNTNATCTLSDATIEAKSGTTKTYGVYSTGTVCKIYDSVISGDDWSVYSAVGSTYVANTQLNNGITKDAGAGRYCAGTWDSTFTFYTSCPP